jgi:hypothetical protein
MLAVDADSEDYTKNSSNLSGFGDTPDRIAEYVCATAGIPIARLFGRTSIRWAEFYRSRRYAELLRYC